MYKIKELNIFEFDEFAEKHPLRSYYQTSLYALFLSEQGYEYELLGLIDENKNIKAASLIAIKKVSFLCKIAYAPRGFLIDYYDKDLLKEFCNLIIKRYYKKNIAYIKINPEIATGNIDIKSKNIKSNKNKQIEKTLEEIGFIKKNEEKPFSNIISQYNAILLLKESTKAKYKKPTRNKINKSKYNGLYLEDKTREDIKILFPFVKNKYNKKINEYNNLYNCFSKNNSIDILLVKVNFEESLINERKKYDKELIKNQKLVNKLMINNTENNLKNKLNSDIALNQIKENIAYYTQCLSKQNETYIAGAITIKYQDRIYIVCSGYDKKYKNLCPNYFLYYEMIKKYQKEYNFIDLNGIDGSLQDDSKYKGLNDFILGFNPKTFEYIGEYDLIINEGLYQYINSKKKWFNNHFF